MGIDRQRIVDLLTKKGATKPCHRCGASSFTVLEAYNMINLQDSPRDVHLGGPTVPVALVACNNCGAITSHALGALGLLSESKEGK